MEFTKEQKRQMQMIEFIWLCNEHINKGLTLTDSQIECLEECLEDLDKVIVQEEIGECYAFIVDMCEDILCSL